MCVLKVYSNTNSFKEFANNTDIPLYSCFDKGESITTKQLCEEYRISFDISDREWDEFEGQVSDAILFLEKYTNQIKELFATHSITDACLDFPLWSRLDENIVNQNDYIPRELIKLAGELNIGIGMSIYAQNAFEFENEKENYKWRKMPTPNARSGVRQADVLGRNIVPIFPPERQAVGTLVAMQGQSAKDLKINKKRRRQ
jgi:hypothetical protein